LKNFPSFFYQFSISEPLKIYLSIFEVEVGLVYNSSLLSAIFANEEYKDNIYTIKYTSKVELVLLEQ